MVDKKKKKNQSFDCLSWWWLKMKDEIIKKCSEVVVKIWFYSVHICQNLAK